ncbi:MAG: AAA family ATPase, partial [Prevotella sp.]|nr:AAA family ATPase [Prevotella sp.]
EEYFQFVGKANDMAQEDIDARLADFATLMQGEILGQKKLIRDLSAGNKQKVGIVSALLARPQLVILDEPFNFLDPSSQIVLKRMVTDYHAETGATILISSHNLQHTIDISTRIALMENGHIVKDLPNENGSAEKELEEYFSVIS